MRRCQVFNISAGVSVPSFAIKPGMSFYAGLRERGEHILEYVFWGVFRSLLWHVPFTINSTLFSYPLRGNGMGGVSLASDAPRHCAENGRCAVCSTPASSGGPGGTQPPCLDLPSGRLIRPSHGTHPPGPNADVVQKRSGRFCPAASPRCAPAFSPVFLTRLNPRAVLPWPSRCDILAEGFSAAEWSAWNNRTCRRGLARLKIAEAQAAGGGKPYRASPNSQTAETKVSRRDDFSCRNAGFPGPGESGPGAFTCSAGNRNMVNGIFPRTYVPECEAPFTPATVYRLALVGDKPKKRVTFQ